MKTYLNSLAINPIDVFAVSITPLSELTPAGSEERMETTILFRNGRELKATGDAGEALIQSIAKGEPQTLLGFGKGLAVDPADVVAVKAEPEQLTASRVLITPAHGVVYLRDGHRFFITYEEASALIQSLSGAEEGRFAKAVDAASQTPATASTGNTATL